MRSLAQHISDTCDMRDNKRPSPKKKNQFKRRFCAVLLNDPRLGIDGFTCKHDCYAGSSLLSLGVFILLFLAREQGQTPGGATDER